jgi:integrase
MEVADLEVTTRERYEDLIRLYIVPTFGDLQAGRLDAELLERFYARLHRCEAMCGSRPQRGHVCTPLSTSTTRKIHYLLRGALGRAARWGYVSVNAAELAQAPSPRKPRPDPPSAKEAADLLNDAWTDPEWGLLLWLTMITGLRRGELCALRWRHIDLERANLWVERSTAHSRTGLVDKETKTDGQRRLSLDPNTVELLRTHRDTVTEQLAVLGVLLDGETYVFSTTPDYSQPRSPKAVTQKYRKMATRLRLRSTRLHALRHYSPTELLAAGVDLRTVSGRLGHSSGVTTLRVRDEAGAEAIGLGPDLEVRQSLECVREVGLLDLGGEGGGEDDLRGGRGADGGARGEVVDRGGGVPAPALVAVAVLLVEPGVGLVIQPRAQVDQQRDRGDGEDGQVLDLAAGD